MLPGVLAVCTAVTTEVVLGISSIPVNFLWPEKRQLLNKVLVGPDLQVLLSCGGIGEDILSGSLECINQLCVN